MRCLCSGLFFFQAEDGIRDIGVTGVQTCALPIFVDVEFLAQALQLVHGHDKPDVRRFTTTAALEGLARAGALDHAAASGLVERYRLLRRISAALRLLGARPSDPLELAGPMPAPAAAGLG